MPTFPQDEAQRYVFEALKNCGFTGVKTTDPLSKYQFQDSLGCRALAFQINKLLPGELGVTDAVADGWVGKNVSAVINSVEYVT